MRSSGRIDFADPHVVLPQALSLFARYRAADRPAAGTARLYDVLGAIGFLPLANARPEQFLKIRMPIDVQQKEGRLYRVLIFPSDLANAFDSVRGELPAVAKLEDMLDGAPLLFWTLEYSGFGDKVVIEAPRTRSSWISATPARVVETAASQPPGPIPACRAPRP